MSSKAVAAIPCIGSCCCFGSAFAVTLSLALNYGNLLARAQEYDEDPLNTTTYDECSGIYGENSTDTSSWTMIYNFNFILYTILACLAGSAILCVPCAPFAIVPMVCFACSGVPTLAAIILTGIRLLGDTGAKCAEVDTLYNPTEELSFQGDADYTRKLWITQMVFQIPLTCMMGCGVQFAILGMVLFGATSQDGNFFKM